MTPAIHQLRADNNARHARVMRLVADKSEGPHVNLRAGDDDDGDVGWVGIVFLIYAVIGVAGLVIAWVTV